MAEQLGTMLVRLRQRMGYTQLRVAEGLCAASGITTVTRHEVSRWERQERIPSVVWLRWLAVVLEVPVAQLAAAAAVTRREAGAPPPPRPAAGSATAILGEDGATVLRLQSTVQQAGPAASAPQAHGNGRAPLSRVTIEYSHQSTSVRLSATYDDPQRALSAIGAFRSMVCDSDALGTPLHTGRLRSPCSASRRARARR
jgi:transcriptional regulator with XRE-family HTH domain